MYAVLCKTRIQNTPSPQNSRYAAIIYLAHPLTHSLTRTIPPTFTSKTQTTLVVHRTYTHTHKHTHIHTYPSIPSNIPLYQLSHLHINKPHS
ncbi:hypothetical protein DM02DRAFT_88345 [Periconia macrospinosa]|uniref:Uncharacterized protein n=1 Tax=Periconia macrospinosa TaxID=97972 RepID=A0A2V1DJ64_9PLEO|nr:hypothetical protein DM02DRAFT_88345 [Periconia macrospinosa]